MYILKVLLFAKKLLTRKALLSTSYCICLNMLVNAYALVKTSLKFMYFFQVGMDVENVI